MPTAISASVGDIPNIRIAREEFGLYENDEYQGQRPYAVIEDEARTWIIFTDSQGRPETFCGERDELGGVVGPLIPLK